MNFVFRKAKSLTPVRELRTWRSSDDVLSTYLLRPLSECWIVQKGREILGMGVRISLNSESWIGRIYVAEHYQGIELGKEIVGFLCNRSREKGDKSVWLECLSPLSRFYEKIGFVFRYYDYARNFFQRGRDGERAKYHVEGTKKHIEIWENLNPKQRKLF